MAKDSSAPETQLLPLYRDGDEKQGKVSSQKWSKPSPLEAGKLPQWPKRGALAGILIGIFIFRFFAVMYQRTFYVPDEHFQSLEIAYSIVFGKGQFTWEWRAPFRIRSYLHPLFHLPGYILLKMLNLADTDWLILIPRLQHVFMIAIGDVFTWRLSSILFGKRVGLLTLAASLVAAHNFFSMSRTLSNSLETTLLVTGLYFWYTRPKSFWACAICIGSATTLRISCIVPFCLQILSFPFHGMHTLFRAFYAFLFTGVGFILSSIILDTLMSRMLLHDATLPFSLPHWSYFKINVLQNLATTFGVNEWSWYFTTSLPSIASGFIVLSPWLFHPPIVSRRSDVTLWGTCLALSYLSHKETRFLSPIVPFLLMSFARAFEYLLKYRKVSALLALVIVLGNVGTAYYQARVTNRGHADAAWWLRQNSRSIFSLAECYTLPGQSFFGPATKFGYLTCEPEFAEKQIGHDINNQRVVYPKLAESLKSWNWTERWGYNQSADHILMLPGQFDKTRNEGILKSYHECQRFYIHAFPFTAPSGGNFVLLCKNEGK